MLTLANLIESVTSYDWSYAGEVGLRLAVAAIAAGIVGFEREIKQRTAGLRTNMLVAVGAAGFTIVAFELPDAVTAMDPVGNMDSVRLDPLRVMAAIVGGIGFLGAGAIIRDAGEVRGLTTAAGIWVMAAVGMAIGAGLYVTGLLIAVLVFIILRAIKMLEHKAGTKTRDDE